MTSSQKSILLALVLLNLLVFGGTYVALHASPDQPPFSAQRAAIERMLSGASPTPAPRPLGASNPTRTLPPVVVLAPTVAKPTQPPVSRRVSPVPTPLPPPQPPVVPGGSSPSNPLLPGDAWQTLSARTSVWYKIGQGGDHIDALLQARPLTGMTMEVFTPDNRERAIGQGTFQRGLDGLGWSGGHWDSQGDWLARVTNGNPAPVQYRLVSATIGIGACESISYWEYIGPNLVYWTRCK